MFSFWKGEYFLCLNLIFAWIWYLQDLEPNAEILEIIKDYYYSIKNGRIKHLKDTNLQFIVLIEYVITKPATLTIFEYKVIANKNFYIKEYHQKYNLKEIKQILIKLKIIKALTIKNKCNRINFKRWKISKRILFQL